MGYRERRQSAVSLCVIFGSRPLAEEADQSKSRKVARSLHRVGIGSLLSGT